MQTSIYTNLLVGVRAVCALRLRALSTRAARPGAARRRAEGNPATTVSAIKRSAPTRQLERRLGHRSRRRYGASLSFAQSWRRPRPL